MLQAEAVELLNMSEIEIHSCLRIVVIIFLFILRKNNQTNRLL